jgi:16S rRNA (cytosine1402-N4)-methyltransferase
MMAAERIDEPTDFVHAPVMMAEVLGAIVPVLPKIIVDVTVGGAGHSAALLRALPEARLYAFDRDPLAIRTATERLAEFGPRARVTHAAFDEVKGILAELGVEHIDAILADLGLSSAQLADSGRGMSFRSEGPLDMRMDTSRGSTALELIEQLSQEELADVIYELGEERGSRRIARCIKQALFAEKLENTLDLRRAVVRAMGPRRVGGVDPATRTFQALRMAVNGELDQLKALLPLARTTLAEGGVAAIISFHSLEDRLVKREFAERDIWQPLSKKPLMASPVEVSENPRARSAKLRAAVRVSVEAEPESER